MMERLEKQMEFILEVDKVKKIVRQTYLSDASRKENDAEHSWHLALMAVLLKEYSNEEVDLAKVIPMVLIQTLWKSMQGTPTHTMKQERRRSGNVKRKQLTESLDCFRAIREHGFGNSGRNLKHTKQRRRNLPMFWTMHSHFFSMMHQMDEAGQNMVCTKARYTKEMSILLRVRGKSGSI